MIETQATMLQKLYKEIETEFIETKLHFEEKAREWQRKINNTEQQGMRYSKNIFMNSVNIITKLSIMKPILVCSMINDLVQ